MALTLNQSWLDEFGKGRVPIRFRVSITLEDDSGSITGVANNGSGKARMTSAGHSLAAGEYVRIEGTSYYDAQGVVVLAVAANTFDIDDAYVADDTGTWRSRRTFSFLSGKCEQIAEPESVVSVTPINRALDPVTRRVTVSELVVVLNRDLLVEDLFENYGLGGRNMEVEIGTAALTAANFEDFGGGTIEEPLPKGGQLILTVKSPEKRLMDQRVSPRPINQHPVTVMGDLAGNNSNYDSTTFDWEADTDVSHYVVSRVGVKDFYEDRAIDGVAPADLISALCQVVPGVVIANEDGKLHYRPFDASSADDHWTTEDYRDFEIVSLYKQWANKVTIKTYPMGATDMYRNWYVLEDEASQKRHAFIEGSGSYAWADRAKELSINADWLGAFSYINSAMSAVSPAGESSPGAADGDTFTLTAGEIWSFCGTQWPTGWPAGAQDADAQLTSTRTAYIRVDDEIIEIDQLVPVNTTHGVVQIKAGVFSDWSTVWQPGAAVCRCKNRGALDTTAAAHAAVTKCYDMTIAAAAAQHYIDRMTNGLWVVQCRTSFAKFGTQVADIITFDNDTFIAYGVNGLDSNTKFECVGKKPEGFRGIPSIFWTFAYAGETSPPSQTLVHGLDGDKGRSIVQQIRTQGESGNFTVAKVTSGFGFTDDGGLVGTLEAGTACFGTGESELALDEQITFTASKDTYLGWDTMHEQLRVYETSLGGAAPSWGDAVAQLWKIATDGADITGTTDLRGEDQFAAETITQDTIKDLAITTAKVTAEAITTAKIADLAVETAKLAAEAVTGAKTAAHTIAPINATTMSTGQFLNANARVSKRTRG